MAGKKGGLGKGLDSLIPVGVIHKKEEEKTEKKEPEKTEEQLVRISQVEPNREQPRRSFDEGALAELAESIRQHGIIQPLIVQKKDEHLEIIAGERRWRAAKLAGLKEIPVIIRSYSEQERMELALIENIQREDLNPIEEARAYQRLAQEFHVKHEEIAERVSKSRAAVTNSLRLLKLGEETQQMLMSGELSGGHARALLGLNKEEQLLAAGEVCEKGLSVRETEELVKRLQQPKKKSASPRKEEREQIFYEELERSLSEKIKTRVKIKNGKKNRGKIEIEYYSLEELERIQRILEGDR